MYTCALFEVTPIWANSPKKCLGICGAVCYSRSIFAVNQQTVSDTRKVNQWHHILFLFSPLCKLADQAIYFACVIKTSISEGRDDATPFMLDVRHKDQYRSKNTGISQHNRLHTVPQPDWFSDSLYQCLHRIR